uniref:ribonuclease H n=1 Tax=viral metagenome TaxID=1070528 RepID=A0A6C0HZD3_9ZZZZ
MPDPEYYVYTDGACSNNGMQNASAGIGIFFGIDDTRNVSQKIDGKQTNNTAELTAIIRAYSVVERDILQGKQIAIVSDSQYAIWCCTTYGEKCCKTAYKKKDGYILNHELVKTAYELYRDKPNVQFIHIKAHTGKDDIHSVGNDGADKLANLAIGLQDSPYATVKPSKIWLNVPFAKKDEAKKLGARWDAVKKKWYIYDDNSNKTELIERFSIS